MTAVAKKSLYTHLAGLLEHPGEDVKLRADECLMALAEYPQYPPEVIEEFKKFHGDLKGMSYDDIQGVYSYTFELTSDFTLDLGYHLFDGFKRSSSLAAIKAMYKDNGFPFEEFAKGELPDNLAVVMHFMGLLEIESLRKNFMETFVILGVEKLNKNFQRNVRNIYRHLINVVYKVLETDVKGG